jgi:hypothetical protein
MGPIENGSVTCRFRFFSRYLVTALAYQRNFDQIAPALRIGDSEMMLLGRVVFDVANPHRDHLTSHSGLAKQHRCARLGDE